MIRSGLLSFFMLFAVQAWALQEARLLKQSRSGQTALFNLGTFDGAKEGDFAVIVKELRALDTRDLRIIPVAKARNIKINSDSSVWLLYKIFDAELLIEGQRFLILSESEMLRGRRDPRVGRVTIVSPQGKSGEAAKSALKDDHPEMVKLGDKYQKGPELHKEKGITDGDATVLDLEEWEKLQGERYRTALYKSPYQDDFRRQVRLATFEKLVTAYLEKVNDPEFNYDTFYEQQMRDNFANEFRTKSTSKLEFNAYLRDQSRGNGVDAKLKRELLEKGDAWSEEFSDEEVGQTLQSVSILQEKDRREYVARKPTRYTIGLDYGLNLIDQQGGRDPYRREGRNSLETYFEAIPFLKHPTLERFGLYATFRRNHTALQNQDTNADVDETSIGIGANWYPLYAPYVPQAPVLFLGTFIRSGYARLEAPTARDKSNYTVLSAPGVHIGMRYVFRNNFALRALASMETINLDRYESNRTGSTLPDNYKLVEGKVGFGISYSF